MGPRPQRSSWKRCPVSKSQGLSARHVDVPVGPDSRAPRRSHGDRRTVRIRALPSRERCVFCSGWMMFAHIFHFFQHCIERLLTEVTEVLGAVPHPPHAGPGGATRCHRGRRAVLALGHQGGAGGQADAAKSSSGVRGGQQDSRGPGTRSGALGDLVAWLGKDPGSLGTLSLQVSDPSPAVQPAESEPAAGTWVLVRSGTRVQAPGTGGWGWERSRNYFQFLFAELRPLSGGGASLLTAPTLHRGPRVRAPPLPSAWPSPWVQDVLVPPLPGMC